MPARSCCMFRVIWGMWSEVALGFESVCKRCLSRSSDNVCVDSEVRRANEAIDKLRNKNEDIKGEGEREKTWLRARASMVARLGKFRRTLLLSPLPTSSSFSKPSDQSWHCAHSYRRLFRTGLR